MAVLSEFGSLDELAAMPLDELVEWLNARGRYRFTDVAKTAQRLQTIASNSYVLPDALLESVNVALRFVLVEIRSLERLRTQIDRVIEARLVERPNPLVTIPGIGRVLAAGILAEIGDVQRFGGEQAKVAKFAGLKWRKSKSADHQREETPLTRRGNRYLR